MPVKAEVLKISVMEKVSQVRKISGGAVETGSPDLMVIDYSNGSTQHRVILTALGFEDLIVSGCILACKRVSADMGTCLGNHNYLAGEANYNADFIGIEEPTISWEPEYYAIVPTEGSFAILRRATSYWRLLK